MQQHAEDRPSMASVVLILCNEISLPQPKEPGFYRDKGPLESESSSTKKESSSTNEITFSLLDDR